MNISIPCQAYLVYMNQTLDCKGGGGEWDLEILIENSYIIVIDSHPGWP